MQNLPESLVVITIGDKLYGYYSVRNISDRIYISSDQEPNTYYAIKNTELGWRIDGTDFDHSVQFYELSVINFYDQKGLYGEFSNYYSAEIHLDNKLWPSSEHYYQAQKFLGPNATSREIEYAEIIRQQNTPNKAKILANQKCLGGYKWQRMLDTIIRQYPDVKIRPDWDDLKDNIMRKIVFHKFEQHPKLATILYNTQQQRLAEHTHRDSYWGDAADGTGRNQLGRILSETRSLLGGDPGPWIIYQVLHLGIPPYTPSEPHLIIDGNSIPVTEVLQAIGKHLTVYLGGSNPLQLVVPLLTELYSISPERATKLMGKFCSRI